MDTVWVVEIWNYSYIKWYGIFKARKHAVEEYKRIIKSGVPREQVKYHSYDVYGGFNREYKLKESK